MGIDLANREALPTLRGHVSHNPLATYLNDHLAGSVAAIRLLTTIEERYGRESRTDELAATAAAVRREIEGERDLLEELIGQVGAGESTLRKTAGWFAEQFAEAKMALDDDGDGAFRLLEAAEVLSIGILGKRGLWTALQSNRHVIAAAQSLDFEGLIAQANAQYERMDAIRLGAARATFEAPS